MDLTLPLDHAAIERILPHRYPFLLVDRITEFEEDKRIVGIKNVSLQRAVSVAGT
jgi:3-hydroxyacyl-[acyl-carrier-protein] dehydratase